MSDFVLLLNKLRSLVYDFKIPEEEFFALQKLVLREAMSILKANKDAPLPEADFALGYIGVTEGDRFNIPAEHAMSHLRRAYQNGNIDAGLLLYFAHAGIHTYVPHNLRSENKGILILEELGRKGVGYALHELCEYYMQKADNTDPELIDLVESHRHTAYEYAQKEFQLGYFGGYFHLGYFAYEGFYGFSVHDKVLAFKYFSEGLAIAGTDLFWENSLISSLYNWVGYCQFYGDGVAKNRVAGLNSIRQSADMGNSVAKTWLEDNKNIVTLMEQDKEDSIDYLAHSLDLIDVKDFNDLPPDTMVDNQYLKHDFVNPIEDVTQDKKSVNQADVGADKKKPTKH
jgi:hypothetical protein